MQPHQNHNMTQKKMQQLLDVPSQQDSASLLSWPVEAAEEAAESHGDFAVRLPLQLLPV